MRIRILRHGSLSSSVLLSGLCCVLSGGGRLRGPGRHAGRAGRPGSGVAAAATVCGPGDTPPGLRPPTLRQAGGPHRHYM